MNTNLYINKGLYMNNNMYKLYMNKNTINYGFNMSEEIIECIHDKNNIITLFKYLKNIYHFLLQTCEFAVFQEVTV